MFWAMILKKGGNAPQATDLKRRNKSFASLIKESPATGTYSPQHQEIGDRRNMDFHS
jgi:hypothetical protein